MSSEAHREAISTSAGARWRRSRWRLRARWLRRAVEARFSSSLTRRIVSLNLGGLVVLVVGFLLLSQFRADIIDARTQSLTTQANIIAAAIAASAAVGTDTITLDPEKLLQLAPGETPPPAPNDEDAITFSINPERVGPVLHRLVTPTHTRARIYDRDGLLLLELADREFARLDIARRCERPGERRHDLAPARMERGSPRLRPPQDAAWTRQLGGQRQIAARGRRSACGKGRLDRPRQFGRGNHRFRRGADSADERDPRRPGPVELRAATSTR